MIKTIESLELQVVAPIIESLLTIDEPVAVALLPDHATPVELRIHKGEPVPFTIWHKGIVPDTVTAYSEKACADGTYGQLVLGEFMEEFMKIK